MYRRAMGGLIADKFGRAIRRIGYPRAPAALVGCHDKPPPDCPLGLDMLVVILRRKRMTMR